jgi:2-polyprenyl-3-methyl-5-hydroxy-6-metoxy-1,4-benzoquinol methylase
MEPSVYEYPSIFRRVHMEKPGEIEEETEFLKKVWRRHLKKPVRRVLDIASGDSPHGQILAREGVRVVGIDRSPTMIATGKRASRDRMEMRFYQRERCRAKQHCDDAEDHGGHNPRADVSQEPIFYDRSSGLRRCGCL